ncbi:MAG: homocysteine S-methyltransferase family protein [Anaerolineales bacterium]
MVKQSFLSRINNKEILVADGATGTNLISRGLPGGMLAENWVIDQPEKIIQLHSDFINAGADIILTSTFNATSIRLKDSSLDGKAKTINQKAVQLAQIAVGDAQVYIAGSLGPVGQLLKPYGPLTTDEISAAYAEQAEALIESGVDLLVIETQFDLGEVNAAIRGVRSVTSLPLITSISYDRGKRTMMGISPTQAGKELDDLPVDVIGINCGHSLEENLQNLIELQPTTKKPIWFKPNAGLPHLDTTGMTVYDVNPEQMGAQVPSWLANGAQIVGGCCGTTPQHLAQISKYAKSQ